ncbi:MAG: LysM peptidoglycan-binding domain-containing protein [Bacillota bacterium]|jgi:septum formation inhibitor MinC
MAETIFVFKRTLFLPKGSPPILNVSDIKVEVRKGQIIEEKGNIFCSGDIDILLDYISQDQEDISKGNPWQVFLSLPFELVEEGHSNCPPLCDLEIENLEWFIVAPRALELNLRLLLVKPANDEICPGQKELVNRRHESRFTREEWIEKVTGKLSPEETLHISFDPQKSDEQFLGNSDINENNDVEEYIKECAEECVEDLAVSGMTEDPWENPADFEQYNQMSDQKTAVESISDIDDEGISLAESVIAKKDKYVPYENLEKKPFSLPPLVEIKEEINPPKEIKFEKENPPKETKFEEENLPKKTKSENPPQEVEHKKENLQINPDKKRLTLFVNDSNSNANRFCMRFYRVQPGEEALTVALRFGVSMEQLAAKNKIEPQDIRSGMMLCIPS